MDGYRRRNGHIIIVISVAGSSKIGFFQSDDYYRIDLLIRNALSGMGKFSPWVDHCCNVCFFCINKFFVWKFFAWVEFSQACNNTSQFLRKFVLALWPNTTLVIRLSSAQWSSSSFLFLFYTTNIKLKIKKKN